MGLLIIDETKCKKDGICAHECPMLIIKLKGGNRQLVEWMVFTNADRIKKIAELTVEWMRKLMANAPQSVPPYFPLMVGYPKRKYARLPERKAPKITWK